MVYVERDISATNHLYLSACLDFFRIVEVSPFLFKIHAAFTWASICMKELFDGSY